MKQEKINKKEQFSLLVKSNMRRAYFAALGLVGTHDDAMELSQSAFIRAYQYFDNYDQSRNFFTWYYTILRNLCFNFIRDKKNRKVDELRDTELFDYSSENVMEEFENKETALLIEKAIFTLGESDREIILLKEFENFSYKEISELLGIPIGTVMSKLFYARKKLSKKLQGDLL